MFIKGLISGRFGHKHSHLKKGTVYFRFGYITRWDTIAFHHHSGTSFHTTLNHKYLMSHHVINCSSTKFDNPWIVAKNWYIRQKFEFLFKCCQCIPKKKKKKFYSFWKTSHYWKHLCSNVIYWTNTRNESEDTNKVIFGTFLKVRSLSRSHPWALK